ncbi:hypothetical protein SteCoe_34843 [Stentor coeruleus]|uniref:G protein-coupled receptor GPR1/2/3 C-terminal domain-containing protein n=1 Tax=Stentor coeruleus TaxID=5963 RepID=A0A1R2ATM7_9CILI|nr:hypothetical protein SteCoe_34843 [Stentor coeruleus]
MEYTKEEEEAFYIATLIPSIFSAIGSFLLLLGCLKLSIKNSTTILVIYLGICNLAVSLASIIPTYKFPNLCPYQGFIHIFFQNIGCVTHALIAYSLYKSLSTPENILFLRTRKLFIFFCIIILPTAIYPTITSEFAYEGGWCTILKKNTTFKDAYFWAYYYMRFIFVWASNLYVVGCYFIIVKKYKKLTESIIDFVEEKKTVATRMLVFPIALVLCYFPINFQRFYSQFKKPSIWFTIVCIVIVSLVGAVNCIVYGISNPNVRRKIFRIIVWKKKVNKKINDSGNFFEESSRELDITY